MKYLLGLVAVLFIAFRVNAELLVSDAYVRGLPPGQPVTAAFMTLTNTGKKPLIIVGAKTNIAPKAEIHTHSHHNGVMKMTKVDKIRVAAGEQFVLAPGGYHLMIMGLAKPLKEGEYVDVSLIFDDQTQQHLQLPVRSVLNEHRH